MPLIKLEMKHMGVQKETTINSFTQKLKLAIFSSFYEQTKSREIHSLLAIVLIAFNFLQLAGTYYDRDSLFYFNDGLYPYIQGFTNVMLVAPAVADSYFTYVCVTYIFLFLVLMYVSSTIYVSYNAYLSVKSFFQFPMKFLRLMNPAIQYVLLIPGVELFCNLYKFKMGWTGDYIAHAIIFTIGLLAFVSIAIVVFLFYNISHSLDHDALSRVDNSTELFLCFYEVIVAIVTTFSNSTDYRYIGLILQMLGGIYMVKQYFSLLPYFNRQVSFVYGSCCCSYLWVSLNVCLSEVFKKQDYGGQSIVIILGIIIIFPLTKNLRDKIMLQNILDKRYDKIRNPNEMDIYLRELITLLTLKKTDSFSDMVIMGYITNHKSECSNPECPINSNETLFHPLTNSYSEGGIQNSTIFIIYIINSIYSEFSRSTYANALFHYIYSDFLHGTVGNEHMALMELFLAEKAEPGKQLEFSLYRMKRDIEAELNEMNTKHSLASKQSLLLMDPTEVIEFENLFHIFTKKLEKTTNEHIDFWLQLESVMPDLNLLHKIGSTILASSLELHKIWNTLIKINPNYYKALWLYGLYLSEIKNDRKEGEGMVVKARQIRLNRLIEKNMSDFDTMFSDDTSLIIISGDKDTSGTIRLVSLGTSKLFGYREYDLMGHDVSQLLPPFMARHHSKYLSNYFRTGMKKMIGNDNHTFAINKEFQLMAVSLIVKPVPSLSFGIQYIGVLRQIFKEFEFIITNEEGLIDCLSKGVEKILMPISPLVVQQYDVYIQLICPDLLDSVGEKTVTKFEVYKGVKRLTFMIPKDMQTILHSIGKTRDTEGRKTSEDLNSSMNDSVVKGKSLISKLLSRFEYMRSDIEGNKTSKNYLKQKINYAIGKKITLDIDIIEVRYTGVNFKVYKLLNKDKRHSLCSEPADNPQSIWVNDTTRGLKSIGAVSQALNRMCAILQDPAVLQKSDSDNGEPTEKKRKSSIEEETKELPPITPMNPLNLRPTINNNESILSLQNVITFQKTETTSESRSIDQSKQNISPPNFKRPHRIDTKADIKREPTTTTLHLNAMDDMKRQLMAGANDKPFIPEFTTITTISQNFNQESMVDIGLIEQNKDRKSEISRNSRQMVHSKSKEHIGQKSIADTSQFESSIEISAAPLKQISTQGGASMSSMDEEDDEGFFNNLKRNYEKEGTFNDEGSSENNGSQLNKDVDQNTEGSIGSMSSNDASSTRSVMRHLKSITKSMYTSVTPSSVKNLTALAYIIFILIISSTFINFFVGQSLYSDLHANVGLVKYAQQRQSSTIYIDSAVRELTLINQSQLSYAIRGDLFNTVGEPAKSNTTIANYYDWLNQSLWVYSCRLRDAQSIIGMIPITSNITSNDMINSPSLILNYGTDINGNAIQHSSDSWTALMSLVLHAQNIRGIPMKNSGDSSLIESVDFILLNSLNSIMMKISDTMSTLSFQNWETASKGQKILLILMIVSTIVCTVALAILIPVIMMISMNVEEVLMLFLQIHIRKVREEIEKCRKYLQAFKTDKMEEDEEYIRHSALTPLAPVNAKSAFSPVKKAEKKEAKPSDPTANEVKRELIDFNEEDIGNMKHNKKYKQYSKNVWQNITKFIISIALLESYFTFCYIESTGFYSKIVCIIDEMGIINARMFSNSYLYIAEIEMLSTNNSQIQEMECRKFLEYYVDYVIGEQENFLKLHSDNMGKNQRNYNVIFDGIIYQNLCDQIYSNSTDDYSNCSNYMGGILQKGLHSANVAYWDNIREILNQYKKKVIVSIDSTLIIQLKLLNLKYLEPSYWKLIDYIEESIAQTFTNENSLLLGIFVFFIFIVVLLFMVVWRAFIYNTRKSLFNTKTMIAIIPPEVIFQTCKIREYVLKSTRQMVYQTK